MWVGVVVSIVSVQRCSVDVGDGGWRDVIDVIEGSRVKVRYLALCSSVAIRYQIRRFTLCHMYCEIELPPVYR